MHMGIVSPHYQNRREMGKARILVPVKIKMVCDA